MSSSENFTIIVPVWGEKHSREWVKYSFPTYFSENNIPFLLENNNLLSICIVGDRISKEIVKESSLYKKYKEIIRFAYVNNSKIVEWYSGFETNFYGAILTQSFALGMNAELKESKNKFFIPLNSDFLVSDGLFKELAGRAQRKEKVVMGYTLRVRKSHELLKKCRLGFSPNEAITLFRNHPHPSVVSQTMESKLYNLNQHQIYFEYDKDTMIAYHGLRSPLLVNPTQYPISVSNYFDFGFPQDACPGEKITYINHSSEGVILELEHAAKEIEFITSTEVSLEESFNNFLKYSGLLHRNNAHQPIVLSSRAILQKPQLENLVLVERYKRIFSEFKGEKYHEARFWDSLQDSLRRIYMLSKLKKIKRNTQCFFQGPKKKIKVILRKMSTHKRVQEMIFNYFFNLLAWMIPLKATKKSSVEGSESFDKKPPLVFFLPIWGRKYCANFMENSIFSLLYNLKVSTPLVEKISLLIFTTKEDEKTLKNYSHFIELSTHCCVKFHYINIHKEAVKYDIKSKVFKNFKKYISDPYSIIFLLNADIILAKDFVKEAIQKIESGYKVIEVVAPRTRKEEFDNLSQKVMSSTALANFCVKFIHESVKFCELENECLKINPSQLYWRNKDQCMAVRCFHFYPLVLDSSVSFEQTINTIDDDLIFCSNVTETERYFPKNSKNLFCCELTSIKEMQPFQGMVDKKAFIKDPSMYVSGFSPQKRIFMLRNFCSHEFKIGEGSLTKKGLSSIILLTEKVRCLLK